jgi:hypothetical protein
MPIDTAVWVIAAVATVGVMAGHGMAGVCVGYGRATVLALFNLLPWQDEGCLQEDIRLTAKCRPEGR